MFDEYDPIFDFNGDGKLDSFERNEYELFAYGDGSMHEPDGMRPGGDTGGFFNFGAGRGPSKPIPRIVVPSKHIPLIPKPEYTPERLEMLNAGLKEAHEELRRLDARVEDLKRERENLKQKGD